MAIELYGALYPRLFSRVIRATGPAFGITDVLFRGFDPREDAARRGAAA